MGGQLADVERVGAGIGAEPARPVQVVPLAQVLPAAVEDLHARVLAIGDVDEAGGVGGDVVRDVEAAGVGARLAPGQQVATLGIELVHARVAVAVGDVDVAGLRAHRRVRRPVERLAAVQRRGLVGITEGEPQRPGWCELADRVVQVVGEPHGAIGPDADPVRAADESLAPRAEKLAVAIEDDDRVRPAIEDPHVVAAVHGDAGCFDERPAVGKTAPSFHRAIAHDVSLSVTCRTVSTGIARSSSLRRP